MAKKQGKNQNQGVLILVLLLVGIVVLAIVVSVMQQGGGATDARSQAATQKGLTPGDDINSLEQDLNVLGVSTSIQDEIIHFKNLE